MAKKTRAEVTTEFLDNSTRSVFGKNYLDTQGNSCKHIRDMFKDWDRHIYNEELLKNGSNKDLGNYVFSYERHLRNNLDKYEKQGVSFLKKKN